MESNLALELLSAAETALINKEKQSSNSYRPKLVFNDSTKRENVLYEIDKNLRSCIAFDFSVAFITESGLEMLLQTLKELEQKDVKGRIITTDYLNFSQPKALRKLLSFSNIETHIAEGQAFHTKGYSFKDDNNLYTIMVGSANLTDSALKTNKEMNIRTTSLEKGGLVQEFNEEFDSLWENTQQLTNAWIDKYEDVYKQARQQRAQINSINIKQYIIQPNIMQSKAIQAIEEMRSVGKDKALLIAATGTGKTYLSAFDVRNYNPNRMLFIVHRNQILQRASESFIDILGNEIKDDIGFITGQARDMDKKYTFSTIQTMCKEDIYRSFAPDHFDYIIIDEVHHAAAPSYQKLITYFKPKFLLGMSATPDRPDANKTTDNKERNIYKLFDYNIAYEIRLNQAMEYNLLCPFHYFGISDIAVNGKALDDYTDFKYLASEERVRHIIKNAEYYGYSGDRVKGLIFCSQNGEAQELSDLFNTHGYNTVALSGENSIAERLDAVARLEQDEDENHLDYIFTVDIFNEGIDIPSVNQIIMLRPTQSAIVFVQQLGRGLRKLAGKEFVVVIDFIANYQRNYMIPIALSGDNSYDKDNLRRFTAEGSKLIAGTSTVNFDQISKDRIYKTIDEAKLSDKSIIYKEYDSLRYKLGRIPALDDFDKYNSISVLKIIKVFGSYHSFLKAHEKDDYDIKLSKAEEEIIDFISQKLVSGKRLSDLLLLKLAVDDDSSDLLSECKKTLKSEYNLNLSDEDYASTIGVLTNAFSKNSEKDKFSNCVFLEETPVGYSANRQFKDSIKENNQFKEMVEELLEFGLNRYSTYFSERYKDTNFTLYEKYTYEDVCWLLNWKQNQNAQNIGGYFYDKETHTMPVFVNYQKADENSIQYQDRFLDEENFIALSKTNRATDSIDANHIYKRGIAEQNNRIYLFVRKNKSEGTKEFYFLGEISAIGEPIPTVLDGKKVFEIHYRLSTPVRQDILDYMLSDIDSEMLLD